MLEELALVKASSYRRKVLISIEEYPKTIMQIADESNIHRNNISYTLKELKDYGLVECINPEVRRGRLYGLTDEGEEIFERL